MIVVVQRVTSARVVVQGETVGTIDAGFLALVGVLRGDGDDDIEYVAKRLATLRVFADDEGRMNRSVVDIGGAVLVVSQFTLAADTRKGRRPSFIQAMPPEEAAPMIDDLVARLEARGIAVESGVFGAHMEVTLLNDGPVTILLDSRETRRGHRREAETAG